MLINLVTYILVVAPLAYFFAFEFGEREQVIYETGFFFNYEDHKMIPGLGLPGLWIGLICGFVNNTLFYTLVAYFTDWSKIS